MGVFVQKVALDFGESYLRMYVHETKDFTQVSQSKWMLQFERTQFDFKKSKAQARGLESVIRSGIIQDEVRFAKYLRYILAQGGLGKFPLARIELYLCAPSQLPNSTKQIWNQACERIGVSKLTFVSLPIAAAVGAGFTFPISTVALLLCLENQGGEIAAVSLSSCLFSNPIRLFSDSLDVYGPDLVLDCQSALEKLSVEELSLCSAQGLLITGGVARIDELAEYISAALSIPVYSSHEPGMAALHGAAKLISFLERENR